MNRNASIAIAKALVIASVVLGHILEARVLAGNGSGMTEAAYLGIYLFHMPFFFLLSGWLFKEPMPAGVFFRKKFLHLMLPYAAWLLVSNLKAIAGFGVNLLRGSLDAEKWSFYLDHFSSQLYGGLEVHGAQMILWFPTCLFFTQQLANGLMLRVPGTGAQAGIVTVCFSLGYLNQYAFPGFHLPLAINVVAGALPFFFLGHWLKRSPGLLSTRFAGPVFAAALVAIAWWRLPLGYHMRMADYGIPVISTVAAVGGFLFILNISHVLGRRENLHRLLRPIGDASMTIMYLHAVILGWMYSRGLGSPWLLLAMAVAFPLGIHAVLARVPLLRTAFLGGWSVFPLVRPVPPQPEICSK